MVQGAPLTSTSEIRPIIIAKEQPHFVETPHIRQIVQRAHTYLGADFPLHFSGPAGTGKTTLAMYVAAQLGQPIMLIHGDAEFGTSDLVGGEYGFRRKKVVDNFIHSVLKAEESVSASWVDQRVTVACRQGFTLIYDEFTRSRPEANNVLLSVLEEKILDLPAGRGDGGHLRVHPNFRAIFTSNPGEYAGVHRAQDALSDRMITIKLGHYDRETEVAITEVKAKIARPEAERIVNVVRGFRDADGDGFHPTVRACIMIGKVLRQSGARAAAGDETFVQSCVDILDSLDNSPPADPSQDGSVRARVLQLIKKFC